MKKLLITVLMVASAGSAIALAENDGDGNGDGKDRHKRPPIEALKACEGKSAGAQVQFETRNGRSINGTCTLIAVPERKEGGDDGEARGSKNGGPAQGAN